MISWPTDRLAFSTSDVEPASLDGCSPRAAATSSASNQTRAWPPSRAG